MPDVILVRKSYAEKRRKKRQKGVMRPWTLKRMDVQEEEAPGNRKQAQQHAQTEAERERFLEVRCPPPPPVTTRAARTAVAWRGALSPTSHTPSASAQGSVSRPSVTSRWARRSLCYVRPLCVSV
jgi:hypothetical protein